LGEQVRRAQWVAIGVGFVGVIIVLRPQAQGFVWAGTLAVLGTALCYALSSVLVKIIGRTDSTQSMVFWMTGMLAIGATLLALPGWRPILREHHLLIAGVAMTGAIGQWGITEAFKHAPAASVAPLEYSGLAWVIIIDFAIWSAIPTMYTLLGAVVIIGSGLYLLRHEARRTAQSTS
jgi:drug/metabolite transporter (DMT)-like permease